MRVPLTAAADANRAGRVVALTMDGVQCGVLGVGGGAVQMEVDLVGIKAGAWLALAEVQSDPLPLLVHVLVVFDAS